MDTLTLRFINEEQSYAFEVDVEHYPFPLQVNNAFIAFTQSTGKSTGQLELFHPIHGWQLICVNHTYPIISNPLALNYDVLAQAIYETMSMINTWSVPEGAAMADDSKDKSQKRDHLRVVK